MVVTGASGFIGRAVVKTLTSRGINVVGVTRGRSGDAAIAWEEVADYGDTPRAEGATLIHLGEESDIASAVKRGSAHVDEVRARAQALADKGFRRLVYASSSQVYRGSEPNAYVAGKLAAEAAILAAGGVVVRLANVYGPDMPRGTVISDIVGQIPGHEALRLRRAGTRRDFLWIDDAAEGLAAVAMGTAVGVFDVGSGVSVSTGELARLALDVAGEGERPVRVAEVDNAVEEDVIRLDTSRARSEFGWQARVGIREGLARLVKAAV